MTVNKLMAQLRSIQKAGGGKLVVELFAHDHDPTKHDEGDGVAQTADTVTTDDGRTIVAIKA